MTLALLSTGRAARLICGDAVEVLRKLSPESVDAVVTDPPSSIGFMGVEWDGDRGGRDAWVAWLRSIMELSLAALKPGGHALVWALPKRSHWTALAVEDAGFEIRDVHHHIFGQGMPKSKATLKPAVEHWVLGRKPFRGSLKACIEKHGTGGLNIDACRIGICEGGDRVGEQSAETRYRNRGSTDFAMKPGPRGGAARGRWPAHLSLDEIAADVLDEQAGIRHSHSHGEGVYKSRREGGVYGQAAPRNLPRSDGSEGGASRFFYVAKPARSERTAGGQVDNDHETVKSIALMSWLVRLITPPGGIVLDPFAGSGTTGVACAAEGMSFIGVEQNPEHHETARRRMELTFCSVAVSLDAAEP